MEFKSKISKLFDDIVVCFDLSMSSPLRIMTQQVVLLEAHEATLAILPIYPPNIKMEEREREGKEGRRRKGGDGTGREGTRGARFSDCDEGDGRTI